MRLWVSQPADVVTEHRLIWIPRQPATRERFNRVTCRPQQDVFWVLPWSPSRRSFHGSCARQFMSKPSRHPTCWTPICNRVPALVSIAATSRSHPFPIISFPYLSNMTRTSSNVCLSSAIRRSLGAADAVLGLLPECPLPSRALFASNSACAHALS